jgi:glutamate--cysteine ligase
MSEEQLYDDDAVHGYVARVCFKKGPPHHVGAELEWLVAPTADPARHVPLETLADLLRDAEALPAGSRATLEPGGQVELSSPVADDLDTCWRNLELDAAQLDRLLAARNLTVLPAALDHQPPHRVLHTPRYDAMQAYFNRRGSTGLVMMTSTASVQVNLDAGRDSSDVARRWALLHALGPALVAAFANSPTHRGRPTGWKSTRQRIWQRLDPDRTRPPTGVDPVTALAQYALAAPVMLRRRPGRWQVGTGFTFRDWLTGAAGSDRPTEDDLAYHLSTLFPPVRPRGWLEVRYVDAQPPGLWPVPLAVITALLNDPYAADQAAAATEPVRDRWSDAARVGLTDPALARAAADCFAVALAALSRLSADPALTALVEHFHQTYLARGRCPADDPPSGPDRPIALIELEAR